MAAVSYKSLDHLTAVFGVGSSPALETCETSIYNVLLAGVRVCQVVFLEVLPFFAPPTDWPASYEL